MSFSLEEFTSIADHHSNRGQTLDREDGFQFPALDALVNLVTQLAMNQKSASIARVFGIRSSNEHHTHVYPSLHREAYAANIYSRPPRQQSARNDAIVIRGVQDVATDTSDETGKLEDKLDALVNLVTQLAVNQISASIARTTTAGNATHWIENMALNSQQFSIRNDAIVIRGLHDVATDTSTEIRKLKSKLDAFVNLVTQLVVNQKSASTPRVFDNRSSNDHHTNVCPSLQQSGVNEHPEAYGANIYSRPPQQQRPYT
ncbi:hypothetical protein Fmac_008369 [Flemingia macrophylla]|uniref:Uncharacterized protein n=1 Tax=Flemingia macrophylla TaxID=520843 RepID=A0ABD1MX74_9FABA